MTPRAEPETSASGDEFILDDFFPYRVVRLGRAMSEALGAVYKDEGITIPEWRVLAVIAQSDTTESDTAQGMAAQSMTAQGMAARDVTARTPMDKMAVSRAAASLEQKSLVTRTPDATDRRVAFLRLTPSGRAIHQRIAAMARKYQAGLLATIDDDTRQNLLDLLRKLETEAGAVQS